MPKRPLDSDHLHLLQDLLVTVINARMAMDAASARADLLLNIFLAEVESVGKEERFIERAVNHLELDLLDARDAPDALQIATADMAKAIWAYRMTRSEERRVGKEC